MSFQGLLSAPPQLRRPPVRHSRHSPQRHPRHLLSQSHDSHRSRPTTATTREARSLMIFTNWWTTGRRRLSRQPINHAPPWTRSNSRDASRTWRAECHPWEQLHMRYSTWRCALRDRWLRIRFWVVLWSMTFDALMRRSMHYFVQRLPSVSDEMPCWSQQVPAASFLPPDCCFRPWYAHNPSSQLLSNAPPWVPFASRLLWRDGSWSSLLPAVAWHA